MHQMKAQQFYTHLDSYQYTGGHQQNVATTAKGQGCDVTTTSIAKAILPLKTFVIYSFIEHDRFDFLRQGLLCT